jgi:hypothetical protein
MQKQKFRLKKIIQPEKSNLKTANPRLALMILTIYSSVQDGFVVNADPIVNALRRIVVVINKPTANNFLIFKPYSLCYLLVMTLTICSVTI